MQRRKFIKKSSNALTALLASDIVFSSHLPKGLKLLFETDQIDFYQLPGKHAELIILNDKPINAETPPHLLDPEITPSNVFFVRNNGIHPERSEIKLSQWKLTIDGESCFQPKTYTFDELRSKFKTYEYQLTLECGGNGRKEFDPPAKGNQWSLGAVGCPMWKGVRLRDVLEDAGIKKNAVYIGYYGSDRHLSGDPSKESISRGVPMHKAFEDESLIAWEMNRKPLPLLNGYPLRLVFGGWPASCSGKWLNRISIRNKVHDGQKMGGQSYRVPCQAVKPGAKVSDENMCIIESMPVKSLITNPKTGAMINEDESLEIRGHAWAGDHPVRHVHCSIYFGSTWKECELKEPANRLAWQRFSALVNFPKVGYYEIWAKAIDNTGKSQPMVLPGWNPKGYLNNACHRIAVKVS